MNPSQVRILSTGGKKLVRTVGGVTRTYDLIDRISLFKDGAWCTLDIPVELKRWVFVPQFGPGANNAPSNLCRAGAAAVVLGKPTLLS